MKTIGAFDAKTHLSSLLKSVVDNKEEIIITKHNRKIARIIPYEEESHHDKSYIVEGLREIRSRQQGSGLRMKDLIEEGRRG